MSAIDRVPFDVAKEPPALRAPDHEAIRAYFVQTQDDYGRWSRDWNMHFGYWSRGMNPFDREAMVERMNVVAADALALDPASPAKVVDLGCGTGATARSIARRYARVEITGVTLVHEQIQLGAKLNRKAGLARRIGFILSDFADTWLGDGSQDGALAIESFCYAPGAGKFAALREAARLLKPGAARRAGLDLPALARGLVGPGTRDAGGLPPRPGVRRLRGHRSARHLLERGRLRRAHPVGGVHAHGARTVGAPRAPVGMALAAHRGVVAVDRGGSFAGDVSLLHHHREEEIMNLLYLAATSTLLIGLAHSYLGERYILMRLFRRGDLPKLSGSDVFTRRVLRFAWHLTTVAWWGFGAQLALMASGEASVRNLALALGVTFVITGAVIAATSRGRHLAWPVFLFIGWAAIHASY